MDLVCLGEPLAELAEIPGGDQRLFRLAFGGDVSNVAVAAARQGLDAAMVTALGEDAFGRDIRALWDREGVDHRHVSQPPGSRTGIYFISYGPSGHEFSYARDGSAASRFAVADLPQSLLASAKVLHASAISQAIGPDPCEATVEAMRLARGAGRLVSYDTNLRLKLWGLERARAVIASSVAMTDILRPGLDDARLLTGLGTADEIADHYLSQGPKIVALTLGEEGCLIATPAERRVFPGVRLTSIDATGAGDTFTGAFLAEYLRTKDPFAAGAYANVAAALQTCGTGAIDPIPRRAKVEALRRELGL